MKWYRTPVKKLVNLSGLKRGFKACAVIAPRITAKARLQAAYLMVLMFLSCEENVIIPEFR